MPQGRSRTAQAVTLDGTVMRSTLSLPFRRVQFLSSGCIVPMSVGEALGQESLKDCLEKSS